MATNQKEVAPMRKIRYRCFLLLSSLLLLLTGCSFREVLDDYPVSGVQITLEWDEGVNEAATGGVRVFFYPKDAKGVKFDSYLPMRGGTMKVIPGRYSVVIYNYDTESVQIRGDGAYETIEAFTGNCSGLGIPGADKMVWEPDPLYVVSVEDVEIEKSDEVLQLVYKPRLVVKSYSFEIKVGGMQHVAHVVGSVDGMANCYFLGKDVKSCYMGKPVFFEIDKSSDGINGSFCVFGMPDVVSSRAEMKMILTLVFVKVDNSIQTHEVDITEIIMSIPPEEGGGTPEITLPMEDVEIEVEKPTNPPIGGGGGIGGDLGDWGEDDEVEL